MILLTRLNGQRVAINCDLIERVEETPNTVITMIDGNKHLVQESIEDVIDRVRQFRASIVTMADRLDVRPSRAHLQVVAGRPDVALMASKDEG